MNEDNDDINGKTRLASTNNVDYRIESVVAPNAVHQASTRSLGNEMVIGGSSNNMNLARPTQIGPVDANLAYRPEHVISTEVLHNNYGQGNSMASLGAPVVYNDYGQASSMASVGGSGRQIRYNDYAQGNSLGKPINPQGNSMANLSGSIQYHNYAQANSVASLSGSIRENRINPMESGANVVDRGNDFQIKNDHQRGLANVNTSASNLQNVGYQQDGSGVLTGSFVPVPVGQVKEVYDNMLGSMVKEVYDTTLGSKVYLLDQNQSVDGLEPFTPDTNQYNQSMPAIEQAGMVNEVVYGNQQGEDTAYKNQIGVNSLSNQQFQPTIAIDKSGVNPKIEDNRVEIKPMHRQNTGYQNAGSQVMTTVYDQNANIKPRGQTVYDQSIGEMVFVPNDKAQVDGQVTMEVNARKEPEKPLQG